MHAASLLSRTVYVTSVRRVSTSRPPGLPPAFEALAIERWGTLGYREALARQLDLHAERLAGRRGDTVALVSHPPTFTLGRSAPESDIVASADELAGRGIAVVRSDRGGRATYHGPGQVVLYPVVGIDERGLGVKRWVRLLEDALLEVLGACGVRAARRPGTAGLWTRRGKIASIGLRVVRGVSYHGVSLNVDLDASAFDCIVTCGVRGESVTTIAAEIDEPPDETEIGEKLALAVASRLEAWPRRQPAAGSPAKSQPPQPTAFEREP